MTPVSAGVFLLPRKDYKSTEDRIVKSGDRFFNDLFGVEAVDVERFRLDKLRFLYAEALFGKKIKILIPSAVFIESQRIPK